MTQRGTQAEEARRQTEEARRFGRTEFGNMLRLAESAHRKRDEDAWAHSYSIDVPALLAALEAVTEERDRLREVAHQVHGFSISPWMECVEEGAARDTLREIGKNADAALEAQGEEARRQERCNQCNGATNRELRIHSEDYYCVCVRAAL